MTDTLAQLEEAYLQGIWRSAGATHAGRVRRVNEDAFVQRSDIGVWAVADGMGGHQAGDVASGMIVDAIEGLSYPRTLAASLDAIDDALGGVNRELVTLGEQSPRGVMGSTAAVLALDRRGLGAFMWAGDSRVYRYREGRLDRLSTDHSQVEEYIAQGLITPEEAPSHPESNVITRALGSHPHEVLEADLCDVSAGDRFLLCSDGLMRHVPDLEIASMLAHGTARAACAELMACTLERGSVDNTTVIVVDVLELRR
jgi:serine/threonine protein phosphatase PrpC